MAKKKYYESKEMYADMESRRNQEMKDGSMISEDRSAIANLPQQVIMKEYPKNDYFNYDLNDDIKGIDVQMRDDVRGEKRKSGKPYPEKY